jgi:hypothetical protein
LCDDESDTDTVPYRRLAVGRRLDAHEHEGGAVSCGDVAEDAPPQDLVRLFLDHRVGLHAVAYGAVPVGSPLGGHRSAMIGVSGRQHGRARNPASRSRHSLRSCGMTGSVTGIRRTMTVSDPHPAAVIRELTA